MRKEKKVKIWNFKKSLGIDFFSKISSMNVWFLQIMGFKLHWIADCHKDYRYFVKVVFFTGSIHLKMLHSKFSFLWPSCVVFSTDQEIILNCIYVSGQHYLAFAGCSFSVDIYMWRKNCIWRKNYMWKSLISSKSNNVSATKRHFKEVLI